MKTIKPKDPNNKRLKAHRIKCYPRNDIVVADNFDLHCRYVLSMDGVYKMALRSCYSINYVSSIAITNEGLVAFTDWSTRYVTLFGNDGTFVNRFEATTADSDLDHNLTGIATDNRGHVIVWASQEHKVTQYSCPDGDRLNSIQVDEKLQELTRITVNSKDQLLFYDDCTSRGGNVKVVLTDSNGRELFAIKPKIGERETGKTYRGIEVGVCGLALGKNDQIYLALKVCTPNMAKYSGLIGLPNTGHIHRYSSTGEFQQCVIRGLHSPHDLAMTSDGALTVANDDSILKYNMLPV